MDCIQTIQLTEHSKCLLGNIHAQLMRFKSAAPLLRLL